MIKRGIPRKRESVRDIVREIPRERESQRESQRCRENERVALFSINH